MAADWGKDVTRLMSLTQQSETTIATRIQGLITQNEQEHERLYERIEGMTQRQTVLMTSMEAMEAQMRELVEEENESVPDTISLTGRLPKTLYEEPTSELLSRPRVQDSVTSPAGQPSRKGSVSPENPKKPPVVVYA